MTEKGLTSELRRKIETLGSKGSRPKNLARVSGITSSNHMKVLVKMGRRLGCEVGRGG